MKKPLLVKLTLDRLLEVLNIQNWDVRSILCDAHTHIEKDEDLQTFIHTT